MSRVWKAKGAVLRELALALGVFAVVSLVNVWVDPLIGYQAVALVYLLAVVLLGLFLGRGAILFGTAMTAVGWDYLFAEPRFSFHIAGFYDKMMLATYFIVALTVGQLTALLRRQRLAEQRLREAERESRLLAESERLGRTLLSSVSHELRTPLAAMTSAAQTLCASGPLTSAQEELAVEIEVASARLNRVVEGLLSAARVQSGQLRPKLDWCDISDLVRVALRSAKMWLTGRPIQNGVAADLPLVKADFVLLEQALANLLLNAATHTPKGTPVKISARVEDKELIVEVADRGPGIPREDLEQIFEIFHRSPNIRARGMGLGLAIVKGFVEAQGGRVRAANRDGGGAAFQIILPAAERPELVKERV